MYVFGRLVRWVNQQNERRFVVVGIFLFCSISWTTPWFNTLIEFWSFVYQRCGGMSEKTATIFPRLKN